MNAFVEIIRRELLQDPLLGVEVGVSQGKTSAALLQAFSNLRLVMVDSWATYPANHPYRKSGDGHSKLTAEQQAEHKRNALAATEFAADRRTVLHATSLAASWQVGDGQADFVILDGAHDFGAVSMDLGLWWPKLMPGGLCVLDDLNHPRDRRGLFGVTKAAEEFAAKYGVELHRDEGKQKGWLCKATKHD